MVGTGPLDAPKAWRVRGRSGAWPAAGSLVGGSQKRVRREAAVCGTFCFSSGKRRKATGAKRRGWAWSGQAGCPRLRVWELDHTDRAHGHVLSGQNLRRDFLNHVLDTQWSLTVVPLGTGRLCAAWELRTDFRAEAQTPASPALTWDRPPVCSLGAQGRFQSRGSDTGIPGSHRLPVPEGSSTRLGAGLSFPPHLPSTVSPCSRSWTLSSQPSQGWREHP